MGRHESRRVWNLLGAVGCVVVLAALTAALGYLAWTGGTP